MTRTLRLAIVTLAVVVLAGTSTLAQRPGPRGLTQFFVFGDSLSDTGNIWILTRTLGLRPALPPSEPPNRSYFAGRFSNGPVAFEYLWGQLTGGAPFVQPFLGRLQIPPRGAVSFAFGASGSEDFTDVGAYQLPGLGAQIELFSLVLPGRRAPRHALYAVFTGANDYVVDPGALPADPADVVDNIARGIRRLYFLGARDIIVPSLPDLGLLPIAGDAAGLLSLITLEHNARLDARLRQLSGELRGLNIIAIDLDEALEDLPPDVNLTTPALDALFPVPPFGVPASLCLFLNPSACPHVGSFTVDPRYFFWDAQHPTTAIHATVADYMYGAVLSQLWARP